MNRWHIDKQKIASTGIVQPLLNVKESLDIVAVIPRVAVNEEMNNKDATEE